ncbi:MAG: M12 family metallo-peptidase, partial [Planctomycetota bacterium]|nr:M12 family metallo-peptidase [Planctomycetota bacterium]
MTEMRRRTNTFILLGISVGIAQPSSALADDLQNLFVKASEREEAGASTEPSVVRTRAVRVNFDLLTPLAPRQGDKLRLNLFDDVSFVAIFERSKVRSPGSYTWFGHLADEKYSSLILVVEQGVMAGSIRVPGKGVFQVGYLGSGVHVIREIDESKLPPCGVGDPEGMGPQGAPIPCTGPNNTCVDDGSQIDVLVVYSALARVDAGGTAAINALILSAFATTNGMFTNSLINTQLNLVLAAEIDYDESEPFPFTNLIDPNDGIMDEVHALRDEVRADLVNLILKDSSAVGQLMQFGQPVENYGFTLIPRSFSLGSFSHEIGHNMGCAHQRAGNNAGFFEYSFGYQFFGDSGSQWHTRMSGPPGTLISLFSNPNVLFDGQPTGIPAGQPDSADNARTMNETALMIANIRPSVPPDCNGNGIDDDEDIANGTSADENKNGVPDVCDIILRVD